MQNPGTLFSKLRFGTARSLAASAILINVGLPIAAAQNVPNTEAANGIEEIVVTAQRREQRLQDVGISVTALSAESLANLNVSAATDIVRAIPSLKMNAYSSAQVVFNIRGVSQNDYGDQQEPPVAVYQDDSYSSSINLASFPIFDLARVEALRGPQGTLFGRNATGGAIQFISQKPTKEFAGYAAATAGRFGQMIIEGALSGPLSEHFQGRLAVYRNKDDGYMKSIVPGIQDRGANDHYAVRGAIAWQPNDRVDINLTSRYMKADKERQAGLYSHEAACPNAQFQGEFTLPTQSCAFWGTGPGQTGTGFRNDAISPSRAGNPWRTAETTPSYVDRKIFGSTLHVNADLGSVQLVSITDYQNSEKFYVEGGDSSPDDGVFFFQGSRLNQVSEEVRLSTSIGANELVAGLFGMKVRGAYTGKFADPFYGYDPDVAFSQRTDSWAAFAQDEWKINDQFKLIAGLRYWSDQREGAYFGSAPIVPGLTPAVTIIFNRNRIAPLNSGVTVKPSNARKSFDGVTARLELDYKPNNDVLWYGSFNRGSKSGGFTFSTGTPYSPNEAAFLNGIPFKPEVLNSYELGLKSTLGHNMTFNASAFYYKYDDYQAFAQFGPVQTVINLNAKEFGLEAELSARPVQGVTLQVGASYLDSKVKDITLPDLVTVEDHELPQAPRLSANALVRLDFPALRGMGSLQTDMQYSDKFCFTVLCAPVEREKSYFVANVRVGYEPEGGHWKLAAFVDNLFEEKYRVYAFDSSLFSGVVAGVYAKPRTYGLSATYRFGAH